MNKLKIHFLNTIWSDAILLEANGHYAFIDTGSAFYYPMIEKHLNDLNIKEIDFILISHFHNDHYGCAKNIIDNYKVNKLYLKHYHGLDGTTSSGYDSNEEYIENEFKNYYNILNSAINKKTEIIYMDDLKLDCLEINFENNIIEVYDINNRLYELYSNPKSEFYLQKKFNENFNCAGIFIKVNKYNIFLGADVSCSRSDIEEVKNLSLKMLEQIYNKHNIDHIDLYKSCHHGGSGTNTKELCDYLKANICVITNTARWLDNWNTFENLRNANPNVNILTTDHQKYIFTIDENISYETITEDSLFLTLSKD